MFRVWRQVRGVLRPGQGPLALQGLRPRRSASQASEFSRQSRHYLDLNEFAYSFFQACHTACAADATLDEDAMETAATEEEDDAHSKPSPFVFASGENESATTVKTEFSAVASCH